jgi:putative oxidoreductase
MTTLAGAVLLAGRIMFAGLFAYSARGHLQNHQRFVGTGRGKLPLPMLAGWPTGIYLLVGDLSIVLGVWPDIGALMLATFVLAAAVLFHPFWSVSDPALRRTQESSFYRNVSLLGAGLMLFAFFASSGRVPYSITGPALSLR